MGALALLKFVVWWFIAAALRLGSAFTLRQAFAPNCQGRWVLPSGTSLLLATKHSDAWDLRYKEFYKDEHGR